MKKVLGATLMLGAALAQSTWAFHVEVAGAFPNLVLVAVVAITWTEGARAGMIWACLGGLLLDLTAAGPIGPHAVALLACAYLTGFWQRNLDRQSLIYVATSALLGTACYSLALVALDAILGMPPPALPVFASLTLAAGLYNSALVPLALAIARWSHAAPSVTVAG